MNQFIKVSSAIIIVGASIIMGGCSSESEENTQSANTKVASSAGIEVVANSDAHALKVKEKNADTSGDKSYYFDYGVKAGYDQNAKPANDDASVRVKPRTSIDANLHVRSPYDQVTVSMMVNKLSKKFIVKCSACHSDYANGIIGPSLLGKNSEYIYKKIKAFKENPKLNVLMSGLVSQMDDAEIREMANEVYRFNQAIQEMKDK